MTSDFIFSRAQIQRSHRISAESLGMDFKELVIRLARPISTREVLEDLDTRGLSATECGAIAWATENQDAGFTGGLDLFSDDAEFAGFKADGSGGG